jgi:hypothetical protein
VCAAEKVKNAKKKEKKGLARHQGDQMFYF